MSAERILIIEDDQDIREMLEYAFAREGWELLMAKTGEEGLELLQSRGADCVVLDIMLPGMDGLTILKKIREDAALMHVPVIMTTSRGEDAVIAVALKLGADNYLVKPYSPRVLAAHILVQTQKKTLEEQRQKLKNLNNNLQKLVEEKTRDVLILQDTFLRTMAELVEYRDSVTGGHIERTQRGVDLLLHGMQKYGVYREEIDKWNIRLVIQSTQLHDVGKIAISDSILKKPGRLDADEFEIMKTHTSFGEKVIASIEQGASKNDFLKHAKIFAGTHHEKWDGSGYPYKLKERDIPLQGRLMAIVDVYDALISVRPYKKAIPHEEAIQIITENRETWFDPLLVDVFNFEQNSFVHSKRT